MAEVTEGVARYQAVTPVRFQSIEEIFAWAGARELGPAEDRPLNRREEQELSRYSWLERRFTFLGIVNGRKQYLEKRPLTHFLGDRGALRFFRRQRREKQRRAAQ